MAKKQEPELFSANLFTTSTSGGAEPFGFGDSTGALPSAPILFAAPSDSAPAVDPFASLSGATSNPATQPSPQGVQNASFASPPVGGAVSVDGRASSDLRTAPAPGDSAPAEILAATVPQQHVPYGGAMPPAQPTQAESLSGPGAFQHSSSVDLSAPGPVESAQLAGPGLFPVTAQQPATAATISGAQFSMAGLPGALAGPPSALAGPPSALAGPGLAGFSAPSVALGSPAPTMPQGTQYNHSAVMEPINVTSTMAGVSGFVNSEGGFPMHTQPLSHPTAMVSHPTAMAQPASFAGPSMAGPPQVSAHVQPVATAPYQPFQQPAQMRAFPIEEEWREQEKIVESHFPPLLFHWFYCSDSKWTPFSQADSARLEEEHGNTLNATMNLSSFVPTDGGRYDVELESRQRHSVYWDEPSCDVRRSSWFFKPDPTSEFLPYREDEADALEKHYQQACVANVWPARFDFKGSTIHMHGPMAIVHLPPLPAVPGPVRRGLDPAEAVDEGEPTEIDHLVFVVHGVGPVADLHFRSIFKCVDDYRHMTLEMMHNHFPHRRNSRVEFLPVTWHEALHGDTTGVNRKLRDITLGSCGRLRDFVNEFLLDVLFYMSPAYCQTILSTVAGEMERMHHMFLSRNPGFKGDVSVMGHSLGTCILFDLLAHQGIKPPPLVPRASSTEPDQAAEDSVDEDITDAPSIEPPQNVTVASALTMFELEEFIEKFEAEKIDLESFQLMGSDDFKEMGVPMGPRKKLIGYLREQSDAQESYKRQVAEAEARKKAAAAARKERELRKKKADEETASNAAREAAEGIHRVAFQHATAGVGQPMIRYPQLSFRLKSLYCLGSPISMFITVRGGTSLGTDFELPTCEHVMNIFHPFDPVAYRMEPLVNIAANSVPPSLVPHHKGRKRLHLELRDNLGRVGANLKKNFLESMRYTWQAVQQFAASHTVNAWQEQVAKEQLEQQEKVQKEFEAASCEPVAEAEETSADPPPSLDLGKLNGGERIDYVLQEHPFESFNEYLFAMQSHLCYWTSEDSSLLILRHMYSHSSLGIGGGGSTAPATPADVSGGSSDTVNTSVTVMTPPPDPLSLS